MKKIFGIIAPVFLALAAVSTAASAAAPADAGSPTAAAKPQSQYTFVLFWRRDDRATQQMQQTLQAGLTRRTNRARWVKVHVQDPKQQYLIARFDATRLPLPATVAIAPNGAVTNVSHLKISPQQIDGAFVSPAFADCVKALQEKKIVLACVQTSKQATLPAGVAQFVSDPHYKNRTSVVRLLATDPGEAEFLRRVKAHQAASQGAVIFFAPPGVHLGTFDGSVTGSKLTATIKAAGQCCPDCKKNQNAR